MARAARMGRGFPLWLLVFGIPALACVLIYHVRGLKALKPKYWGEFRWLTVLDIPDYGQLYLLAFVVTLALTRWVVRRSRVGPISIGVVVDATVDGPSARAASVAAILRDRLARNRPGRSGVLPGSGGIDVVNEHSVPQVAEDAYTMLAWFGASVWRGSTRRLGWRVNVTIRESPQTGEVGLHLQVEHLATGRHEFIRTIWAASAGEAARIAAYEVSAWRMQQRSWRSTRREPRWRPQARGLRDYEDSAFYVRERRLDEALRSASTGLAADPSNLALRRLLGETYERLGRYLSAIHVYAAGLVMVDDVGNGWSRTVHDRTDPGNEHRLPDWPRFRTGPWWAGGSRNTNWHHSDGLLWRYVVGLTFADLWVDEWIADLDANGIQRPGSQGLDSEDAHDLRGEGHPGDERDRRAERDRRDQEAREHADQAKRLRGYFHRRYQALLESRFCLLDATWFTELHERTASFQFLARELAEVDERTRASLGKDAAWAAEAGAFLASAHALTARDEDWASLVARQVSRLGVRDLGLLATALLTQAERAEGDRLWWPVAQGPAPDGAEVADTVSVLARHALRRRGPAAAPPWTEQARLRRLARTIGPNDRVLAQLERDCPPGRPLLPSPRRRGVEPKHLAYWVHEVSWFLGELASIEQSEPDQRGEAARELLRGVHSRLHPDAPEVTLVQVREAMVDDDAWSGLGLDRQRLVTAVSWAAHEVMHAPRTRAGWSPSALARLQRLSLQLDLRAFFYRAALDELGRAARLRMLLRLPTSTHPLLNLLWSSARFQFLDRFHEILPGHEPHHLGLVPTARRRAGRVRLPRAAAGRRRSHSDEGRLDPDAPRARLRIGTAERARRTALWWSAIPARQEWTLWYYAACVHALVIRDPADRPEGVDPVEWPRLWKRRYDPFAEFAVRALNHAILTRGARGLTLIEAGSRDWMLYEDPDLDVLRQHPRFQRWASANFDWTAPGFDWTVLGAAPEVPSRSLSPAQRPTADVVTPRARRSRGLRRLALTNEVFLAQVLLRKAPRAASCWRGLVDALDPMLPIGSRTLDALLVQADADLRAWEALSRYRGFTTRPDLRLAAVERLCRAGGGSTEVVPFPDQGVAAISSPLDPAAFRDRVRGAVDEARQDRTELRRLVALAGRRRGQVPALVVLCSRGAARWDGVYTLVERMRD